MTTDKLHGEVHRARSRRTGTVVIVLDARIATWLDPDGGRWITMCDEHGTVCNHVTRKLAMEQAPTVDWCEDCTTPDDSIGN